ncbi:MAG: VOC family protein, partial [Desulfobacca sp.]|uniref:VOC family protein n=1 Tax=Desulfobacca sp. TaxID=2067990 RepID=UPI00404A9D12
LLLAGTALHAAATSPASKPEQRSPAVQLTHVCIITPQFARMKDFYQRLLQLEPKKFTEDYVEFQIPGAIIALYEEASFAQMAPEAVPKPGSGGFMLELQVVNVDREFERLHSLGLKIDVVLPPTTFPWGNRSLYLRDPDGNLLNLYHSVPTN